MNLSRLAQAAAILVATAVPAAAQWGCEFTDRKGAALFYMFDQVADGVLAETMFTKNGVDTVSRPGERPPWTMVFTHNGNVGTLTYVRDPRFSIIFGGQPKARLSRNGTPITNFDAYLFNGDATIGKGTCNFPNTAGQGV